MKETWEEKFLAVRIFFETHKVWPSQRSKDIREKRLAQWCNKMRQLKLHPEKLKDKITTEQIFKLEEIGFAWVRDPDIPWMLKYDKLCEFRRDKLRWPSFGSDDRDEFLLALWCGSMRNARKGAGQTIMNKTRTDLLNSIGFNWEHDYDEKWIKNYLDLKLFIKREQRWPIQTSLNREEIRLYTWCNTQRRADRNGVMTDFRKGLLDEIGFSWVRQKYCIVVFK